MKGRRPKDANAASLAEAVEDGRLETTAPDRSTSGALMRFLRERYDDDAWGLLDLVEQTIETGITASEVMGLATLEYMRCQVSEERGSVTPKDGMQLRIKLLDIMRRLATEPEAKLPSLLQISVEVSARDGEVSARGSGLVVG